ncbi:MAG: restriction endonuclease subunit S [Rhodanobacter sp.]
MSLPKYGEYKDSGVAWLGEVPAQWEIAPLKRLFDIVGGSTPKSESGEFWGGDIVWVSPADLSKLDTLKIVDSARKITNEGLASCGTTLVPPGSLVLSTRAPIGSLAIADVELCTNQGCKSLVPKGASKSGFYAYMLLASTEQLNLRGKGTTFLELSADELGAFRVVRPEEKEQSAIAAFLDRENRKIDALIAEQERLLTLLAEKRQATISHAVTHGISPSFPMKDSGVPWLGEVAAHWDVRTISSLSTKITNGFVGPTRDILVDEGVRYLQSLHVKRNVIRFDCPYYVRQDWSEAHAKSILETGDVLIVQTGDIGQAAVVTDEFAGCNCHALIIVAPVRDAIDGRWLSWVLNSDYGFHSLLSIQTGALHPHLNCGNVKTLFVPLPPMDEQLEIVAYIRERLSTFDELSSEAERAIELLKERRNALIAAAVTGKIDVRQAA